MLLFYAVFLDKSSSAIAI